MGYAHLEANPPARFLASFPFLPACFLACPPERLPHCGRPAQAFLQRVRDIGWHSGPVAIPRFLPGSPSAQQDNAVRQFIHFLLKTLHWLPFTLGEKSQTGLWPQDLGFFPSLTAWPFITLRALALLTPLKHAQPLPHGTFIARLPFLSSTQCCLIGATAPPQVSLPHYLILYFFIIS